MVDKLQKQVTSLFVKGGTKYIPAENVGLGKDHTIFALVDGTVVFKKKRDNRSYVSVEPAQA